MFTRIIPFTIALFISFTANHTSGEAEKTPPSKLGVAKAPSANKRLAIIIDASGSMAEAWPFALKHAANQLKTLTPNDQFTIIFFQRDRAIEAGWMGMKNATPRNLTEIQNWIDHTTGLIVPRGTSDPTPALNAAFSQKPTHLAILSNNLTGAGKFKNYPPHIINHLSQLNQSAGAIVNAIQLLAPNPDPLMQTLAKQHRGQFNLLQSPSN